MLLNALKTAGVICMLSLSTISFANEEVDLLSTMEVSADEIQKSLEKMKASGQISERDFEKAKIHVSAMGSTEIKSLTETAVAMVKNDPDKAVALTTAPIIDTDEATKQINALSAPSDQ